MAEFRLTVTPRADRVAATEAALNSTVTRNPEPALSSTPPRTPRLALNSLPTGPTGAIAPALNSLPTGPTDTIMPALNSMPGRSAEPALGSSRTPIAIGG